MASEIIERVAKALEAPMIDMSPGMTPQGRLRLMARAAIKALREPTAEMLLAAQEQPGQQSYADVWRAMIDTALADPLPVRKANME